MGNYAEIEYFNICIDIIINVLLLIITLLKTKYYLS